MTCRLLLSCRRPTPLLFLSPVYHFCPRPPMSPRAWNASRFFPFCSNYCPGKVCQRAKAVLIRGPAVFCICNLMGFSLGTRKNQTHQRVRDHIRAPGYAGVIFSAIRLVRWQPHHFGKPPIEIDPAWLSRRPLPGKSEGLSLSSLVLGLDSSTCVQGIQCMCIM